ncbi:MgtC/SapB family protein [Patescibacteria group bacterium]|nr:MgtC/SapB family protein [Patescibacteria group bacterium]
MNIFLSADLVPFLQIILATFFGMLLGIERVLAGRMAGPRTYGLVSLGACLITILSQNVSALYPTLPNIDPMHMIASIITGIGFIGAGLIIFRQSKLSGITTAAGIWVAAAIGISVGFKFYILSLFCTFLTLFIFTFMWKIENKIKHLFKEVEENE